MFRAFEGRGPLTVVQIDAHLDWRDEVRGEKYGWSSPMRRASEMPWIRRMVAGRRWDRPTRRLPTRTPSRQPSTPRPSPP